MEFNKKKCVELMVESKKLLQQGKSLHDYDPAKNTKLAEYLTLLYDDVFWASRHQYLQILESFTNRSIDINESIQKFYDLRCSNMKASETRVKNLENEIDFQLNPEAYGFTDIISSIDMTIDLFDSDITLEMDLEDPELTVYGMSEESLRLDIKENFLPIIYVCCKKY